MFVFRRIRLDGLIVFKSHYINGVNPFSYSCSSIGIAIMYLHLILIVLNHKCFLLGQENGNVIRPEKRSKIKKKIKKTAVTKQRSRWSI